MRLFSLDGPFQKWGTIAFDLMILDLYWFFISTFSFGLLMGPANVALYKAVHTSVIHAESSPTKAFFSTFKNKFKRSFLGSLLGLFALISSVAAIYWSTVGLIPNWTFPIYFALVLYIIMIFPYFMALINETEFKLIKLIKFSFILAVRHLPTTLLILIVMALGIVLVFYNMLLILIVVSPMYVAISYLITDKILSKYDFTQFE